jgi:hypothetical protein
MTDKNFLNGINSLNSPSGAPANHKSIPLQTPSTSIRRGLTLCAQTVFILASIASFVTSTATAGQLTLNWADNSNNESGFRIERSTNGGSFSQIGTVGANITRFTDTAVASFTTYNYRVRAYNAYGSSNYSNVRSASLDLLQLPGGDDRLAGTSIRAHVRKGSGTMIAGFVVKGTGNKRVLVRAIGPSLDNYGVTGTVDDPIITLYRDQTVIGQNDNWDISNNPASITSASELIGVIPLPQGSKDSALLLDLPVGAYTAHVTGANGTTGAALVEVYDADEAFNLTSTSSLTGISMRGEVSTGSNVVIAGFVIPGNTPKRMLIRAVGPELAQDDVSGALNDPLLRLYQSASGESFEIASNDNWGTDASQITTVSHQMGISELNEGSESAAMVIWLEPGVYTAHAASSDGSSGVALVEVYEAP